MTARQASWHWLALMQDGIAATLQAMNGDIADNSTTKADPAASKTPA
jgi:hypothetical protein